MTILFITTIWGGAWGGSEVLWSKTAELMIERGDIVYIYYFEMNEYGNHFEKLKNKGAILIKGKKIIPNPTILDRLKKKIGGKKAGEKRLDKYLAAIKFDAICVSQGGTYDFAYENNTSQAVISSGIPYLIISQHNYENGIILHSKLRKFAVQVFANAQKNCFVSHRNRHVTEIQLASVINNSIIVDNPVQVDKIAIPWPTDTGYLKLAFIGRLNVKNKGLDMLLDALSQCKHESVLWALDIYGKGEEESYLKDLVKFLNLENLVTFKGYEPDVKKIWNSHEALLLTSANEGTPLVVVEAMCCARPVIATDVGDISRFVINDHTGILIEAPFTPVIKKDFLRLLQNRHLLQQWGRNALQHACNETKINPCETLLEIIKDTVTEKT